VQRKSAQHRLILATLLQEGEVLIEGERNEPQVSDGLISAISTAKASFNCSGCGRYLQGGIGTEQQSNSF
jgi:hypothetical protein